MLEKLKEHLGRITSIGALVAAALLVPTVLSQIGGELTEATLVTLIRYALLLAAPLFLFLPHTDTRKALPLATALFYGAFAFVNVYNAISGSLASYATGALYVAVLVLSFLPAYKKAYRMTSLIAIAFFLASALGGGAVNLSILITSLLLAANDYFLAEKE